MGAVPRPRFALVIAILIASLVAAPLALGANTIGVKVITKPKSVSNSTTATFAWRTTGRVARTLCALDRRRFVKCSRHRTYTHLKNGLHTFRVEAVGATTKRIASY